MGSYNTITYYFSKVIADLPSLIVFPVLQGTITYFMVCSLLAFSLMDINNVIIGHLFKAGEL